MDSRKELVENGLSKLVNGNEDKRFLALRDFNHAFQIEEEEDGYSEQQIEFMIIMTKFLCKMDNEAIPEFRTFTGNQITTGDPDQRRKGVDSLRRAYPNTWSFRGQFESVINDLPNLWLKSIKFDAFLVKYEEWKDKTVIERQGILELESVFQSFENL